MQNIFFASLIKEGETTRLLFKEQLHLYAPEFLLEEFARYRELILRKTHRTNEDFNKLMYVLSKRIDYVPKEVSKHLMSAADKVSPDPNDTVYFAVALKLGAVIWSNDARLKKQKEVQVYTTSDLVSMFPPDEE